MNVEGDGWQESVQNWQFSADGSGSFHLKFFTHTVNPEEQGSLTVEILDDTGQAIAGTVVPFQSGAGVSAGAENAVEFAFAATPGQAFGLRVTNPPAVGGIRRAHHYRFEAHGAGTASQNSPGIRLQEGVVPQRWMLNVAPGEHFELQVLPGFPGPDGNTPEAKLRLLDPSGAVWYADQISAPLPRTFMIPDAAGGEWTLDFASARDHFTLDKLSGPDRRLYLTPFSAGRGQIDISVEPVGRPLSLSITNTTTGQTFPAGPGPWPLDVGRYTIVANGDDVTPRSVTVDVPCNGRIPLTFQVLNRPPSVHIMGEPFTITAGGPSIMIPSMASDPDNDPLTFEWTLVSGGGNLWETHSPSAMYSSMTPTIATLQVTVRDPSGATATATTTVTVLAPPNPAHKWHADYTMEWIAPRTSADQAMNGLYPFTYTWRFGILNDPVAVIDAPRITVGTSLSGLSPSQQWLTLSPAPPPYVWNGPQLAPMGQGNSQMFTSLWSALQVPQSYDLGFDVTRNVGGLVAAGASEVRTLAFTMTPRDPTLTMMAAHVNFGNVAPGQPGPVTASNASCTSAAGFTVPFTNPDGSWGVRWQINYSSTTQPLVPGETHTMECTVALSNSAGSPVEWAPYMMASGGRTAPMVVSDGGSVTFVSDPGADPWDPLGTVNYDITAAGELVAQFTKHFSRLVNLDGRNRVLDVTPPVTTPSYPGPNAFGWYTQNVNVSLSAVDAGSGVRHIKYSLNGAPTVTILGSFANVWVSAEGVNTLTFWAEDNAGNVEAAKSITLKLDKTKPIVKAAPFLSTPEGSTLLIPFTATDASGEPLTVECFVVAGLGTAALVGPNTCAFEAGDGPSSARVGIRARDGRGNSGGVYVDIGITDAPPQIISITGPTAPLRVGTPATIDVTYTDPVLDAVTCTFNWQDGTEDTVVAGEPNHTCSATHTYTAAGVYTVNVTVADDDGGMSHGTYQFVVVYNPDAGWVTGGGWIASPAGALSSNGTLTGRANFGFNARYNGDTPQGQTEFQFQNGRLNFHSTSYDWLVVMDGIAAYTGNGTINGDGSYKFAVLVTDAKAGEIPEDRFRIRIWDDATGEVIYDTNPGTELDLPTIALSGGNITLHK